jgi:hypothetical protein
MGNANRDLAQQSATARLQERDAFLNNANAAQQASGQAVQQNFGLATAPQQSLQQYELARTGAINQNNQANAASQNAITGALLGGAGSALGAYLKSDKNSKKDISKSDSQMRSFLEALTASKFAYKDSSEPGASAGSHFGVMAQDLEKTPVGRSMVKDTPSGKMVDPAQGFGALLASQAALHERLSKLEGKKGKKD